MAKQEVINFLQKVKEDESFKAKIKETKDSDQFIELARSSGYDITLDELEAVMKENLSDELSDKDLESIAGGGLFGLMAKWSDALANFLDTLDRFKFDISFEVK